MVRKINTEKCVVNMSFEEMKLRIVCEYMHYSITISACKYK